MCVWHRVYVCSMYYIYKGHAHLVSYELFADYVMTVRGMVLTVIVQRYFCSSFLVMKFVCFMPSVYVTYRDIIQYCDTARWPIFIKKSFTVHIFFSLYDLHHNKQGNVSLSDFHRWYHLKCKFWLDGTLFVNSIKNCFNKKKSHEKLFQQKKNSMENCFNSKNSLKWKKSNMKIQRKNCSNEKKCSRKKKAPIFEFPCSISCCFALKIGKIRVLTSVKIIYCKILYLHYKTK